jgi:mono/diheme cytochrome c family protein
MKPEDAEMSKTNKRLLAIGLLALAALALGACAPQAQTASPGVVEASFEGDSEAGLLLFNENCLECHSATLPQAFVGPTLYEAGDRLTADYIQTSIRDPHSVIDPEFAGGTPMPTDLIERLTDQQLADIVAYLLAGRP